MVDYDDVGDVIAIASEMQNLDVEQLSVEDLRQIAIELDIPDRHVIPAIEELRRRRAEKLAADNEQKTRRVLALRIGAGVVGLFVFWVVLGQASIGADLAEIARYRAQVVNVTERQAATGRQWESLPHSEQKAAELSGAENRVRIERKRYDDAAAAYNARLASITTRFRAGLFGQPTSVPLSNELDRF